MGNFYVNYTVKGPDQKAVATAMKGRNAIVTPVQNGCIVVYDEESDEQDLDTISHLASQLSHRFECPLLAVLNHDDDILWYQLFLNGELVDQYNSCPSYFDVETDPAGPEGGDPDKLCSVFGLGDVASVESILRKSSFDEDGYPFAFMRHEALVQALGLSLYAVGNSYASFDYDEFPDGLSPEDLVRTS